MIRIEHVAAPDTGTGPSTGTGAGTILVGLDGSPEAEEAACWAVDEALVRGCGLRIISCFDVPVDGAVHGWVSPVAIDAVRDEAQRRALDRVDRAVADHPQLAARGDVVGEALPGPAATALTDAATPNDLIVVGASSHRGAAAFWLGSTPRAIIRRSACPVAVVRGPASRGRPDRVVVGVGDGEHAHEEALRWAVEEAARHRLPLSIVHAWSGPQLPTGGDSPLRQTADSHAVQVLAGALRLARAGTETRVTGELIEADPSTALLTHVRDGDMLVVGSQRRGVLRAELFGSTVKEVLEGSAVPVVVVPRQAP